VGEGPVLVTGAGGFVGRTLMERFNLGAGDYATDFSSDFSAPEGVAKIAWELPGPPPSSLGEVRHVVHLAGLSSVAHSLEGEERVVDVNGRGTGSVAEWVREKSPGARLLLAGSSEVYKPSVSRLTEDSRLEPRSPYGHSKLLAESILSSSGTDWLVSRSFPHFGPGQQGHFVLPSFCRRIITAIRMGHREMVTGNLQAVRDYLYIDDVVRAYACILARGRSGGIYNVCSGEGHSIGELLEMLLSIGGCDIEVKTDPDLLRTGDQFCQVGEPSKLRELGWKEEYSLKRGLELLYRWWEERL
jgi:GDP-4-dehydro-6-deoxy-D-mannose reductase